MYNTEEYSSENALDQDLQLMNITVSTLTSIQLCQFASAKDLALHLPNVTSTLGLY